MSLSKLMRETTSAEISEWMAFDMLKDDKTRQQLEVDAMTTEQADAALLALFKGKQ